MGAEDEHDEIDPPPPGNGAVWVICVAAAAVICLMSLYVISCGAMNSDRCLP